MPYVLVVVGLIAAWVLWRYTSIARGARWRDRQILPLLDPLAQKLERGVDVSPQEVAEFAALGIDVVAVGSEAAEAAAESMAGKGEAGRLPFALLADPGLEAFRAWRCFDDFESMPLHGTFLVDGAGRVRWQDLSFEPFVEVGWLVKESARLLALPAGGGVGQK